MGCFALLVWCAGSAASFLGNRKLQANVQAAANAIPASELAGAQLPGQEALRQLDDLRQTVATLSGYEQNGAPWHLRWGIYSGHALYPAARAHYFQRFHARLFAETQSALLASLRQLPAAPAPGADYKVAYQRLKALLIPQGTGYAAAPSRKVKINSAFVRFFNYAAAVSEAMYPGGAQQPKLAFTLIAYPAEGLPSMPVTATVDGQTLTTARGAPESEQLA